MFKTYQLKWCFILIAIISFATILMRLADFKTLQMSQYIGGTILIAFHFLTAWLIIGYIKLSTRIKVSNTTRAFITITSVMAVTLTFSYIVAFYVPQTFHFPEKTFEPTLIDFIRRLMTSFFLCMICYIIFNTIYTSDMLLQTKLENEQFKQAHLRAQLLSIQQQISPHFLFNSLSTLKTITRESDTKHFVMQLSHVYRYLLNVNEKPVTKLSEELNFTASYLYILHIRFQNALNVTLNVPDIYLNYVIPPFSIQLLIENAIKHNAIVPDMPLDIAVYVNDKEELVVRNPYQPKKGNTESTKMGLQNISDRFRLLFDKKISIEQTEEFFTVTLPLIPYERYHH